MEQCSRFKCIYGIVVHFIYSRYVQLMGVHVSESLSGMKVLHNLIRLGKTSSQCSLRFALFSLSLATKTLVLLQLATMGLNLQWRGPGIMSTDTTLALNPMITGCNPRQIYSREDQAHCLQGSWNGSKPLISI